ncbi:MAG: DEAD/DEAH box helicase [Firmicutes bacterium]|nr:DEAD/DEAH box helicase [Bacillota bacterium]MDD4693374.1 DEAD/DEAH box helicase [Bacillota bacterium]
MIVLDKFHGLVLDDFQKQAITALLEGKSVLVSAPTGVGKTLIADYLIEDCQKNNKEVIYTAPIKALSNQKFKQFKKLFGEDKVGIITGDVVINSLAPIKIMTTEIFRNILHSRPDDFAHASHVIFDEIHFIGDEDRGAIWEEAIILMPESMRLLGLSATIPNAGELAEWLSYIRQEEITVITHTTRAVPLSHSVYLPVAGIVPLEEVDEVVREKNLLINHVYANHLDLIKAISKKYLPCLYFVFSRKQCEIKAKELADEKDYLSKEEKHHVLEFFDDMIEPFDIESIPSVKRMRYLLARGIGVHHAGLLPVLKDIVEELFAKKLISVLYCTETFAVGINMPVKAVCFDSVEKFNGVDFRPMLAQEYFQMAGRAGRRGIDKEGHSFILVDLDHYQNEAYFHLRESNVEKLQSRFKLSYNTILHLIEGKDENITQMLLERSFAAFLRNRDLYLVEDALDSLKERYEANKDVLCLSDERYLCPLEQRKYRNKLKNVTRKLRSKRHSKQKRTKALLEQKQRLETLLKKPVKPCSEKEKNRCVAVRREQEILKSELRRLETARRELVSQLRIEEEFVAKKQVLDSLSYVQGDNLLDRGKIALEIHVQELFVTELIASGYFHDKSVEDICATVVGIDFDRRRGDSKQVKHKFIDLEPLVALQDKLAMTEMNYLGVTTVHFDPYLSVQAYFWAKGATFEEILRIAPVPEGDIVAAFRRSIDILRQIRSAVSGDHSLVDKLSTAIKLIDRDVVSVNI